MSLGLGLFVTLPGFVALPTPPPPDPPPGNTDAMYDSAGGQSPGDLITDNGGSDTVTGGN